MNTHNRAEPKETKLSRNEKRMQVPASWLKYSTRCLAESSDLAERKKFWNPKDWTDYLPWEWPIVSVTKTHTKELNSFQYFSHLT